MELQPYGPVEQAIQKSASPELRQPKTTKNFWWGVGTALGIGTIAFLIVYFINKRKEKEEGKKDITT